MKNAFFAESGESVKNLSDLEMRFKAVASEIYSVAAYGDYIFRQGFVQTAVGEYLDRHAELRGIIRKTASYSFGVLTFSIAEPVETDVVIPKNTICSVKNKPYIQFATCQDTVIEAGRFSADADAVAVKSGEEFNIGAGQISVIVNPPDYVTSVYNSYEFIGGYDAESDESLRERIISSYLSRNSNINAISVREAILSLDDIADACVYAGENVSINVCVKAKSGIITEKNKADISNILGFASLCGLSINFIKAAEKQFSVSAEVKMLSGYDADKIKKEVESKIKEFCSAEKIGKDFSESAIASAAYSTEGMSYIEIYAYPAHSGTVCCGTNEFLKLVSVTVNVHE